MTLLIASPKDPYNPVSLSSFNNTSVEDVEEFNTFSTPSGPVLCAIMKTFMTYANPQPHSEGLLT